MNFKKYIQENKIIGLAPMDGFTDEPMRLLQTKIAKPDVVFTEFVSAEGLAHSAIKLFDVLRYRQEERPIIAQLFGKDPESFYKAGVIVCYLGFDGIDINMGCPAKKATQHGSGAALIEKQKLVVDIIGQARKAIDDWSDDKSNIKDLGLTKKFLEKVENMKVDQERIPILSVKTRLGVDKSVTKDWIQLLAKQPIDLISLHGRTLNQGYTGMADWKQITEARKIVKKINPNIVFWGNGDVTSKKQAEEYIKKYDVDGVLIARASVGNPWIFDEKREISIIEKYQTMLMHAQIFNQVFPKRSLEHLRSKFLAYIKGFRNAKQIRKKLVRVSKIADLIKIEEDFLEAKGD